jgi:hypothetical protein
VALKSKLGQPVVNILMWISAPIVIRFILENSALWTLLGVLTVFAENMPNSKAMIRLKAIRRQFFGQVISGSKISIDTV